MQIEIWKDVLGYEGFYKVSNLGNVLSSRRNKLLAKNKNKYGYLDVHLSVKGKPIRRLIHRLVAIAFIKNPENKPEINHKNGKKEDNWSENLEWATPSENKIHGFKTGLYTPKTGSSHSKAKLTEQDVVDIRLSELPQKELAKKYKINIRHLHDILRGRKWKHVKTVAKFRRNWSKEKKNIPEILLKHI